MEVGPEADARPLCYHRPEVSAFRHHSPCICPADLFPHSYLDRNALASARVLDIEEHLGLKGTEFNTCISVFFAGYLTLQIPSNLLLTRVRPSIYLVCCRNCQTIVARAVR
jgi:hypothetical protein